MNIDDALAVSHLAKPGRTWFTHLCHEVMHADLESELPENVRIAFDGLKLSV